MADDLDVITTVTLVDRTGGPSEFLFDGKRFTFTAAKPTRTIPVSIAEWLFRTDHARVWSTDGTFVYRYGIKDGPEELITQLGEEPFDTDPIQIDTARAEGWNTDAADRPANSTRTISLKRTAGDFAHQGGALAGTFSGKER